MILDAKAFVKGCFDFLLLIFVTESVTTLETYKAAYHYQKKAHIVISRFK